MHLAIAFALLVQVSPYRLPWEEGKSIPCTQGNNGSTSHRGGEKYAFDFGMPVGTKVCAARGGKVASVKEDETEGGLEKRFHGRANHVKIQHDDGTVGVYLHLAKDGALVETGETVMQGDVIGLSGATGYVTGAHLHFQVNKGSDSIAVTFADVEGDGGVPQGGRSYVSRNTPGIPGPVKDELTSLERGARLALKYGAVQLAWPRLKRLAEARLRVKYAPVEEARKKIDELVRDGEQHVEAIGKMPFEEAVLALLLARRAYEGTPVRKSLDRLALSSRDGYLAAQAKARDVERAQEAFFRGLKAEIEGRAPEAAYREAAKLAPESDFATWASERLKRLAARKS